MEYDVRSTMCNLFWHPSDSDVEKLDEKVIKKCKKYSLFKDEEIKSYHDIRTVFVNHMFSFPSNIEFTHWMSKNKGLMEFMFNISSKMTTKEIDKTSEAIRQDAGELGSLRKKEKISKLSHLHHKMGKKLVQDVVLGRKLVILGVINLLSAEGYLDNDKKITVLVKAIIKQSGLLSDEVLREKMDAYDLLDKVLDRVFQETNKKFLLDVSAELWQEMKKTLDDYQKEEK